MRGPLLLITIGWALMLVSSMLGKYAEEELLAECEANLPRNEHCVIIAVPEKDLSPPSGSIR